MTSRDRQPRLRDRFLAVIWTRHYSYRTEKTYFLTVSDGPNAGEREERIVAQMKVKRLFDATGLLSFYQPLASTWTDIILSVPSIYHVL